MIEWEKYLPDYDQWSSVTSKGERDSKKVYVFELWNLNRKNVTKKFIFDFFMLLKYVNKIFVYNLFISTRKDIKHGVSRYVFI